LEVITIAGPTLGSDSLEELLLHPVKVSTATQERTMDRLMPLRLNDLSVRANMISHQ
jgi:hypothetical protein